MIKPIFIIRIPASAPTDNLGEQMDMISKRLEKGYYVIPIRDSSVERVEFECYNAENATSIDIEEIKQMVLKQFKNEQ
jgi:nicotinamide mononucleotide adenylyltransferase